jgi:excisionase family DNA binding protein
MTANITIRKISADEIRVTLVADIRISGNLGPLAYPEDVWVAPGPAGEESLGGAHGQGLLTVEQTAELLQISRDRVYALIRSGKLRSIKIGKLRRISREWIAEFIGSGDRLST